MRDYVAGFRLDDRVAVVTGASSGLGVVFAEALASAGASVVLVARRVERLEELADRIRSSGAKALAVACDVTDERQVDDLVATVGRQLGRVDVLVNNAGVSSPCPAEEESSENFRFVLDVNLTGVFYCARGFGISMLKAGTWRARRR